MASKRYEMPLTEGARRAPLGPQPSALGRCFSHSARGTQHAAHFLRPSVLGLISCGGFTYLGLLFLVAILGAVLAATAHIWHTQAQREKEAELLFVGDQFRLAIGTYYERTPGSIKQYPKAFEDLLQDPRFPNVQRYLRRVYTDPMTGKPNWGMLRTGDGGIIGIYSVSQDAPIKIADFPAPYGALAESTSYSNWIFAYMPGDATGAAGPQSNAAAPGGQPGNFAPGVGSGVGSAAQSDIEARAPACQAQRAKDLSSCNAPSMSAGGTGGDNCVLAALQRFAACLGGASPR